MFLLGTGQPNNRMVYYSDMSYDGELVMTNVERAKCFDTMESLVEYLLANQTDLRYIITEVSQVTWQKIQKGYKAIIDGLDDEESKDAINLYHSFNKVDYVTNSDL